GAVAALDVVMQGAAVAQRHADQAALGLFGRLADRLGHFFRLALAEADAAALVAHDDERRKAEALAALDGFRHAVDRDQAVGEFRGFLALFAAAPAVVTFCHAAFPILWRAARRQYRSKWAAAGTAPGSSGRRAACTTRRPQLIRTSARLRGPHRQAP